MKEKWTAKHAEYLFLILILCASLFLFLFNLGNQYLWQDEAQTALISKTIITNHVPLGYDGTNYFSQDLGAEYGRNYIWKWHPWFQFYLLAPFFKFFGVSTFIARLPFALFGIATVFLTYYLCRALAAVLLLLSVPFLLLSRQCRYFAPAAFFSLLGLYGYLGIIAGKKASTLVLAISAALLFHTQFIFCATLLGPILLHAVLFHRNRIIRLLVLSLIIILISLPWRIWVYNVDYTKVHPHLFTFKAFMYVLRFYLRNIRKSLFSPLLLLVPAVTLLFAGRAGAKQFLSKIALVWKKLLLLVFFIIVNLLALSLVSYGAFFRNLVVLIPVFASITAFLLMFAVDAKKIVVVVITALLVGTGPICNYLYDITHDYDGPIKAVAKYLNQTALLVGTRPICGYLYDITHDYDGPIEGIVNYLSENADKDDIVAITYGDMPLKFYTQLRIVGGLTGEDLSLARQAKWVILRKYVISKKDAGVKKYLMHNLSRQNYERIIIDYPDIPFENREDLILPHHFRTVTDEDRVVIFRKIK
ncbi:MAG: ArnT family glycosyltransferase [Planctomycetota bacterium]|jgi:hypothetical protein